MPSPYTVPMLGVRSGDQRVMVLPNTQRLPRPEGGTPSFFSAAEVEKAPPRASKQNDGVSEKSTYIRRELEHTLEHITDGAGRESFHEDLQNKLFHTIDKDHSGTRTCGSNTSAASASLPAGQPARPNLFW